MFLNLHQCTFKENHILPGKLFKLQPCCSFYSLYELDRAFSLGCFIAKIKKNFIKGRKFIKAMKNQTVPTEIPGQTPTSRNATIIVPDISK